MPSGKDFTYSLEVDGIIVEVTRKRVRNVNLRVDAQGNARMSIPWHMSRERAIRHVLEHRDWLNRSMARRRENLLPAPIAWETGERACVWGNVVSLCVRKGAGHELCSWEGDAFVMLAKPDSTPARRHELFERWLTDDLRMRLDEILHECEARVGVHATSITLRRMKTRWGSCTSSTGRIRLNIALAECPLECLEMVLVHELCHLLESNHGPRFHALMDLHYPSWRVWQRWLDEHPSQ